MNKFTPKKFNRNGLVGIAKTELVVNKLRVANALAYYRVILITSAKVPSEGLICVVCNIKLNTSVSWCLLLISFNKLERLSLSIATKLV